MKDGSIFNIKKLIFTIFLSGMLIPINVYSQPNPEFPLQPIDPRTKNNKASAMEDKDIVPASPITINLNSDFADSETASQTANKLKDAKIFDGYSSATYKEKINMAVSYLNKLYTTKDGTPLSTPSLQNVIDEINAQSYGVRILNNEDLVGEKLADKLILLNAAFYFARQLSANAIWSCLKKTTNSDKVNVVKNAGNIAEWFSNGEYLNLPYTSSKDWKDTSGYDRTIKISCSANKEGGAIHVVEPNGCQSSFIKELKQVDLENKDKEPADRILRPFSPDLVPYWFRLMPRLQGVMDNCNDWRRSVRPLVSAVNKFRNIIFMKRRISTADCTTAFKSAQNGSLIIDAMVNYESECNNILQNETIVRKDVVTDRYQKKVVQYFSLDSLPASANIQEFTNLYEQDSRIKILRPEDSILGKPGEKAITNANANFYYFLSNVKQRHILNQIKNRLLVSLMSGEQLDDDGVNAVVDSYCSPVLKRSLRPGLAIDRIFPICSKTEVLTTKIQAKEYYKIIRYQFRQRYQPSDMTKILDKSNAFATLRDNICNDLTMDGGTYLFGTDLSYDDKWFEGTNRTDILKNPIACWTQFDEDCNHGEAQYNKSKIYCERKKNECEGLDKQKNLNFDTPRGREYYNAILRVERFFNPQIKYYEKSLNVCKAHCNGKSCDGLTKEDKEYQQEADLCALGTDYLTERKKQIDSYIKIGDTTMAAVARRDLQQLNKFMVAKQYVKYEYVKGNKVSVPDYSKLALHREFMEWNLEELKKNKVDAINGVNTHRSNRLQKLIKDNPLLSMLLLSDYRDIVYTTKKLNKSSYVSYPGLMEFGSIDSESTDFRPKEIKIFCDSTNPNAQEHDESVIRNAWMQIDRNLDEYYYEAFDKMLSVFGDMENKDLSSLNLEEMKKLQKYFYNSSPVAYGEAINAFGRGEEITKLCEFLKFQGISELEDKHFHEYLDTAYMVSTVLVLGLIPFGSTIGVVAEVAVGTSFDIVSVVKSMHDRERFAQKFFDLNTQIYDIAVRGKKELTADGRYIINLDDFYSLTEEYQKKFSELNPSLLYESQFNAKADAWGLAVGGIFTLGTVSHLFSSANHLKKVEETANDVVEAAQDTKKAEPVIVAAAKSKGAMGVSFLKNLDSPITDKVALDLVAIANDNKLSLQFLDIKQGYSFLTNAIANIADATDQKMFIKYLQTVVFQADDAETKLAAAAFLGHLVSLEKKGPGLASAYIADWVKEISNAQKATPNSRGFPALSSNRVKEWTIEASKVNPAVVDHTYGNEFKKLFGEASKIPDRSVVLAYFKTEEGKTALKLAGINADLGKAFKKFTSSNLVDLGGTETNNMFEFFAIFMKIDQDLKAGVYEGGEIEEMRVALKDFIKRAGLNTSTDDAEELGGKLVRLFDKDDGNKGFDIKSCDV